MLGLDHVARRRQDWRECQEAVDAERLVFLDETGIKTDLTRLRGWADSSERLVEAIPGGDWETSTLVHAVALDGTRAAMVLDGPLNSDCFTGFCEQLLAPTLHPGDLVILDNLSSHKSSAAIAAVERVGAELIYLPPYSPHLNPDETVWAHVKRRVSRQVVESADDMKRLALGALRSIQKLPDLVKSFFRQPECHYILDDSTS